MPKDAQQPFFYDGLANVLQKVAAVSVVLWTISVAVSSLYDHNTKTDDRRSLFEEQYLDDDDSDDEHLCDCAEIFESNRSSGGSTPKHHHSRQRQQCTSGSCCSARTSCKYCSGVSNRSHSTVRNRIRRPPVLPVVDDLKVEASLLDVQDEHDNRPHVQVYSIPRICNRMFRAAITGKADDGRSTHDSSSVGSTRENIVAAKTITNKHLSKSESPPSPAVVDHVQNVSPQHTASTGTASTGTAKKTNSIANSRGGRHRRVPQQQRGTRDPPVAGRVAAAPQISSNHSKGKQQHQLQNNMHVHQNVSATKEPSVGTQRQKQSAAQGAGATAAVLTTVYEESNQVLCASIPLEEHDQQCNDSTATHAGAGAYSGASLCDVAQQLQQKNGDDVSRITESSLGGAQPIRVYVYWGSQTGSAEGLGERLAIEISQSPLLEGIAIDCDDFNETAFTEEQYKIFVLATYGEGDPTDSARSMCKWLQKIDSDQPWATTQFYAVCGLGNSSYIHFNRTAKVVDQQMERINSKRMFSIGLCDENEDTDAQFAVWSEGLLKALNEHATAILDQPQRDPEIPYVDINQNTEYVGSTDGTQHPPPTQQVVTVNRREEDEGDNCGTSATAATTTSTAAAISLSALSRPSPTFVILDEKETPGMYPKKSDLSTTPETSCVCARHLEVLPTISQTLLEFVCSSDCGRCSRRSCGNPVCTAIEGLDNNNSNDRNNTMNSNNDPPICEPICTDVNIFSKLREKHANHVHLQSSTFAKTYGKCHQLPICGNIELLGGTAADPHKGRTVRHITLKIPENLMEHFSYKVADILEILPPNPVQYVNWFCNRTGVRLPPTLRDTATLFDDVDDDVHSCAQSNGSLRAQQHHQPSYFGGTTPHAGEDQGFMTQYSNASSLFSSGNCCCFSEIGSSTPLRNGCCYARSPPTIDTWISSVGVPHRSNTKMTSTNSNECTSTQVDYTRPDDAIRLPKLPFVLPCTIRHALTYYCDFSAAATSTFCNAVSELCDDPIERARLIELSLPNNKSILSQLKDAHVNIITFLDSVCPTSNFGRHPDMWSLLLQLMPRQRTRGYTISSCPLDNPNLIDLTVSQTNSWITNSSITSAIRAALSLPLHTARDAVRTSTVQHVEESSGYMFRGLCSYFLTSIYTASMEGAVRYNTYNSNFTNFLYNDESVDNNMSDRNLDRMSSHVSATTTTTATTVTTPPPSKPQLSGQSCRHRRRRPHKYTAATTAAAALGVHTNAESATFADNGDRYSADASAVEYGTMIPLKFNHDGDFVDVLKSIDKTHATVVSEKNCCGGIPSFVRASGVSAGDTAASDSLDGNDDSTSRLYCGDAGSSCTNAAALTTCTTVHNAVVASSRYTAGVQEYYNDSKDVNPNNNIISSSKSAATLRSHSSSNIRSPPLYVLSRLVPSTFIFPDDPSCPVVMAAAGTGIAPFRGYLQSLNHQDRKVAPVLFYGCQSSSYFLYKDEFERHEYRQKIKLVRAYSRDVYGNRKRNSYVQHRLQEHRKLVAELLFQRLGYLLVCGSHEFGQEVRKAVEQIGRQYDAKQLAITAAVTLEASTINAAALNNINIRQNINNLSTALLHSQSAEQQQCILPKQLPTAPVSSVKSMTTDQSKVQTMDVPSPTDTGDACSRLSDSTRVAHTATAEIASTSSPMTCAYARLVNEQRFISELWG